jgi:early secretory antigenic target protein ESAT-6
VSGDFTRVNFGGMDAGQQNFVQAYTALQSTLDDLERDLEAKLSEWDGVARQEYTRAKAQWRSAANDMALVLQNLGGAIGTGSENYGGAEKSGAQIWSG